MKARELLLSLAVEWQMAELIVWFEESGFDAECQLPDDAAALASAFPPSIWKQVMARVPGVYDDSSDGGAAVISNSEALLDELLLFPSPSALPGRFVVEEIIPSFLYLIRGFADAMEVRQDCMAVAHTDTDTDTLRQDVDATLSEQFVEWQDEAAAGAAGRTALFRHADRALAAFQSRMEPPGRCPGEAWQWHPTRMRGIAYRRSSTLPLHQDASAFGWVLSISLGASCCFEYARTIDEEKATLLLHDGDVVLFQGDKLWHGVSRIITSPPSVATKEEEEKETERKVRWNLQFR